MLHIAQASVLTALMLVVPPTFAAGADAPLVPVQTMVSKGVAGGLDHLAVDSKGGRLFLANKTNNTLDVFDLKGGKLIQQIPDQMKVSGVVYSEDHDIIYVGNIGGTCNAIDGKTYKVLFSTKCEKADNLYYHSGKNLVYIQHGNFVAVLDATTGEVKTEIDMGSPTKEFRVHKKAERLYINLRNPNVLAVVDLAKNEVIAKHKITMSAGNGPLAFDDKNGIACIGCGSKRPKVIMMDVKDGKELTSVEIPGGIDNLHYDSKRNRLYASCGDGFLVTIERKGETLEVISKIETPKKVKSVFAGGMGRLYLAVPRQEGTEGPEIRVYEARPVIEPKPAVAKTRAAKS